MRAASAAKGIHTPMDKAVKRTHIVIAGDRYIVDEWIEYGDGSVWFKAHYPRTTKIVIGWL